MNANLLDEIRKAYFIVNLSGRKHFTMVGKNPRGAVCSESGKVRSLKSRFEVINRLGLIEKLKQVRRHNSVKKSSRIPKIPQ